jgi:hypothetical protein
MHYVCIENNTIISILNYEPSVPNSVSVVELSDNDYAKIEEQTHYFDIVSGGVLAVSAEVTAQKEIDLANGQEREFLNSTDWKVLRHIRQKALGIPTSLTEEEYLAVEQQRQDAAARIL